MSPKSWCKKRKGGPGRKKKVSTDTVNVVDTSDNIINSDNVGNNSENDPVSSPHVHATGGPSSSRKKLFPHSKSNYKYTNDIEDDIAKSGNLIINLSLLYSAVNSFVVCKNCNENSVVCVEDKTKRIGLACTLVLKCENCGATNSFPTSEKTDVAYDTNLRYVYGLRCIGKGQAVGTTLCAVMDLPKPPNRFQSYSKTLNTAIMECAKISMSQAVREAIDENDGSRDIPIGVDGTWQKRGHTSLNGVVTVTSVDTGKVIDFEVLSKYCHPCKFLKTDQQLQEHKASGECKANYVGSSGGMEVAGALQIFQRSIEKYGVRYTKFLGDGDSKSYKAVCEKNIYNNLNIEKLECIGHVQKRMGTRLRKLRSEHKGKRLSDNKMLSGAGRLSDKEIDTIQLYYGLAIRRNCNNLEKMFQDVWATFFHKISTDEKPQHNLCPKGEDTWCKFNRALVTGETYSHKHSLPVAVAEVIKPVFRSLADRKLLEKCLHGKTQNPNESFHNVIWSRVPKNTFVGLDVLNIGVCDAVLTFNCGSVARLRVLEQLGIVPGDNMCKIFKSVDNDRVKKADLKIQNMCKLVRQVRRNQKRAAEDTQDPDDPEYGSGMY